jgi:DNA-binding NarL/FixJ family response regulator
VLLLGLPALYGEALAAALAVDGLLEVAAGPAESPGHHRLVDQPRPDVIVIAANYAVASVIDYLTELGQTRGSGAVIVLAPETDVPQFRAWKAAGAAAVLTYERSVDELASAIKDLACGRPVLDYAEVSASVRGLPVMEPGDSLTAREREVLQAIADGLTADQAAARLGISSHTIRTHLRHSMEKLQARSRIEAIMIALRKGLIVIPEPGAGSQGDTRRAWLEPRAQPPLAGGGGAPLKFTAVRSDCVYRALVR